MASEFLFREVSDKEKEKIREKAKLIMDDFSEKLRVVSDDLKEEEIDRGDGFREEGSADVCEIDREKMFENAPDKNDDFIIAEKKRW